MDFEKREPDRIVKQMQALSRQILFENVPGIIRRKRLGKKIQALSNGHSGLIQETSGHFGKNRSL